MNSNRNSSAAMAVQQKLSILNKRGEKLVGILHEAGSQNLVVMCHGFRSSKDDPILVNIAAALEKEGITAFRFDFSGNGESGGAFQFGNYAKEVEDIRSVVEYFVGLSRPMIAILGHSKGMEDRFGKDIWERLKKDGYIDVKSETGEVLYRLMEESMTERLNTNMRDACLSIAPSCRVLTVHGSEDEVIPVGDAKEFAKIIRNHQLKIIEGANHGYTAHQDELVAAVLPFIKECMQLDEHTST